MTINVEACWGGKNIYFRLNIPEMIGGRRHPRAHQEFIRRETWDRQAAAEALDLLENVYGFNRRSIRFKHK